MKLAHMALVSVGVTGAVLAGGRRLTAQARAESATLDNLRTAYLAAYDEGDADAMKALYTAHAVRMPYDAPEQRGRGAIVEGYRRSFARRRFNPTLTFSVEDVSVRDDVALERGAYREEQHPKSGAPPRVEIGKYVLVAERGGDGHWRYTTSIFNRDAVPGNPGASASAHTKVRSYRAAGGVIRCLEAKSGMKLEVLLDRAALGGPEVELGRITFPPGRNPRASHRHSSVEILYVLRGTLDNVVNGVSHRLEPGMVGVVRPGDNVIHRVVGTVPVQALLIWAPAGELNRIAPGFGSCRS